MGARASRLQISKNAFCRDKACLVSAFMVLQLPAAGHNRHIIRTPCRRLFRIYRVYQQDSHKPGFHLQPAAVSLVIRRRRGRYNLYYSNGKTQRNISRLARVFAAGHVGRDVPGRHNPEYIFVYHDSGRRRLEHNPVERRLDDTYRHFHFQGSKFQKTSTANHLRLRLCHGGNSIFAVRAISPGRSWKRVTWERRRPRRSCK